MCTFFKSLTSVRLKMRNSLVFLLSLSLGLIQAKNIGIVIGGYGGGNSIEVITPTGTCQGTESSPNLPNAPAGQIAGWFAEYADGLIYLCGGQDINVHKDCYTLNIGDSAWKEACPMNIDRRFSASTVMPDGSLVVLGGYNNKAAWLDSVEVKAAGECQFVLKPSWVLPRKVFDFCAVALDDTHIMIAGGNQYQMAQTDEVDILDTETGVWTKAEPLPNPRSAPGCILTTVNGEEGVMVTGGLDSEGLDHYYATHFYKLSTKKWETLERMSEARMGHASLHVGDAVTVIGGYNTQLVGGIEDYTEGKGWAKRSAGLQFQRYFYGGCEVPESVISC